MKKCVCGRNVACDGSCCEPEEVLEETDQDDITTDPGDGGD